MYGARPLFLLYAFMAWTRINLLYFTNFGGRILLVDIAIVGEMATNCNLWNSKIFTMLSGPAN
jgi:hypothetical protein